MFLLNIKLIHYTVFISCRHLIIDDIQIPSHLHSLLHVSTTYGPPPQLLRGQTPLPQILLATSTKMI